MKAITLRGIPPDVARKIQERADRLRLSLNAVVIQMLEEALGTTRPKQARCHDDLDFLAGTWSEQEAEEFDAAVADQRRIDPEVWK